MDFIGIFRPTKWRIIGALIIFAGLWVPRSLDCYIFGGYSCKGISITYVLWKSLPLPIVITIDLAIAYLISCGVAYFANKEMEKNKKPE